MTQQKISENMFLLVILVVISAACTLGYAPTRSSRRFLSHIKSSVVDDKAEVKEYFDNEGFNRLVYYIH